MPTEAQTPSTADRIRSVQAKISALTSKRDQFTREQGAAESNRNEGYKALAAAGVIPDAGVRHSTAELEDMRVKASEKLQALLAGLETTVAESEAAVSSAQAA
jgi:hypothetical protein